MSASKSRKVTAQRATPKPTGANTTASSAQFMFGKRNFMFMGIGLALIVIGCLLMLGGGMPDPNTWDESLIYSFRRITLAPIFILAGLIVHIYAIFTKS